MIAPNNNYFKKLGLINQNLMNYMDIEELIRFGLISCFNYTEVLKKFNKLMNEFNKLYAYHNVIFSSIILIEDKRHFYNRLMKRYSNYSYDNLLEDHSDKDIIDILYFIETYRLRFDEFTNFKNFPFEKHENSYKNYLSLITRNIAMNLSNEYQISINKIYYRNKRLFFIMPYSNDVDKILNNIKIIDRLYKQCMIVIPNNYLSNNKFIDQVINQEFYDRLYYKKNRFHVSINVFNKQEEVTGSQFQDIQDNFVKCYYGQFKNERLVSGQGTFIGYNGHKYKGYLNINEYNIYDSNIKIEMEFGQYYINSCYFEGKFRNKNTYLPIPTEGTLYYYNNSWKYTGSFIHLELHGKGVGVRYNYSTTTGNYDNGILEGEATCVYNNGDKFEGIFKKGDRHYGTYTWKDGSYYKGYWVNNERHGQGEYYYKQGRIYKGGFENGNRFGYGEYTNNKGDVSKGEWLDNELVFGEINYTNGDFYKGSVKNLKPSGEGELIYKSGKTIKGYFGQCEAFNLRSVW